MVIHKRYVILLHYNCVIVQGKEQKEHEWVEPKDVIIKWM